MMRATILTYLLIILSGNIFAQKPPLDFKAIDNWPTLSSSTVISRDGRFVAYTIKTGQPNPTSIITYIRCTKPDGWKAALPGVENVVFSRDSKHAIFKLPGDTLCLLVLGTGKKEFITGVSGFQVSPAGWLVYQQKPVSGRLTVCDAAGKEMHTLNSVDSYSFNNQGSVLLLKMTAGTNHQLALANPATGKTTVIWRGQGIVGRTIFSDDETKVAFITSDTSSESSLWCYDEGTDSVRLISGGKTGNFGADLKVDADGELDFNRRGNCLFFDLAITEPKPTTDSPSVKMDVWDYKAPELPWFWAESHSPRTKFLSVAILSGPPDIPAKVIQLENAERNGGFDEPRNCDGANFILSDEWGIDAGYRMRASDHRPQLYQISLQSGKVKSFQLPVEFTKVNIQFFFQFSPLGRWMLYFDRQQGNWFSYDMESGAITNITKNIQSSLFNTEVPVYPGPFYQSPAGILGWLKDTGDVLIYDNNDIWRVDPAGIKVPVNITNGYGAKHHIRFGFTETMKGETSTNVYSALPLTSKSELLLSALDLKTKYNGFYKVAVNKPADPEQLTFGPYSYSLPEHRGDRYSFMPIKAKDANTWVVGRATSNEAPNYFLTHDFKRFEQLTDFEPQKAYNWLSEELVNYTTKDGQALQGLLYKPEDIDTTRKYPVIIFFRQQYSDGLYDFLDPVYSIGPVNIPYCVSRGYVVFVPDIHYTIGESGESVVNCVVSGANYLSRAHQYIDPNKMAIQGESFGGWELNYLVTHTHQFAAAVDCYGDSDLISSYGEEGESASRYEFNDAYALGATLWERPDLYIKNSPVFSADKVTSPLLILHNRNDPAVHFSQGVELYTALWKLQKPVWLLQYDGEGHGVYHSQRRAKDWTNRLSQFLDHYLKGAPAPKWMTVGIPPWMKGKEDGLELEPVKTP